MKSYYYCHNCGQIFKLTTVVKKQCERLKMNRPLCRFCGSKLTDPSSEFAYKKARLESDIKQDKLRVYFNEKWFKRPPEFNRLYQEREDLKQACKEVKTN